MLTLHKKNNDGRLILKYYKTNSILNEYSRSILVDVIVQHLLENEITMSNVLAEAIASQVVNLFPTEIKVSFIIYNRFTTLL